MILFLKRKTQISRGCNGSVNISENCDFRSQFDPFYIILWPFILNTFLLAYTLWMKKYKTNTSVSLKNVELWTKTRLISIKETESFSLSLVRGEINILLMKSVKWYSFNKTKEQSRQNPAVFCFIFLQNLKLLLWFAYTCIKSHKILINNSLKGFKIFLSVLYKSWVCGKDLIP